MYVARFSQKCVLPILRVRFYRTCFPRSLSLRAFFSLLLRIVYLYNAARVYSRFHMFIPILLHAGYPIVARVDYKIFCILWFVHARDHMLIGYLDFLFPRGLSKIHARGLIKFSLQLVSCSLFVLPRLGGRSFR